MAACSAFGCTNRFSKKIPGISFHRFPADKQLREKWIIAVRRKDFKPSAYSRLCSAHFTEDSFERYLSKIRLKQNAVPSVFSFPLHYKNSTTQIENWQKVIPRADRIITPKDFVCELHFAESDIHRHFETTVTDGSDFKLARSRPMLKKNAIPTIFPNLPGYSSKISRLVKRLQSEAESTSNSPSLNLKPGETDQSEVIKLKATEADRSELEKYLNNEVDGNSSCNEEEKKIFSFNNLVQNLSWISTPNAFWGVTAHNKFVMCARWDENYALKKRVIIDHNLKIKVYVEDADFSLDNADVRDFEEISSLLDIVESFKLNS